MKLEHPIEVPPANLGEPSVAVAIEKASKQVLVVIPSGSSGGFDSGQNQTQFRERYLQKIAPPSGPLAYLGGPCHANHLPVRGSIAELVYLDDIA